VKRLVYFCIVILGFALTVWADTMYVGGSIKIMVRTAPATNRKIISMLNTGQQVDVLQEEGNWARVRLPDGKEGWALSQYLTASPPARLKLERLEAEHQVLKAKSAPLIKENQTLKTDLEQLESELADSQQSFESLESAHEALKQDASEYLSLKAKFDQLNRQMEEQKQFIETCEGELVSLERNRNIRWFLSGAGVLVVGFIIGFSTRPKRRRSSLL